MTGAEFKQIRWGLGLTVRDFAFVLGYKGKHTDVTIRDYENGSKPIPLYIGRLAIMLGRYGVPDEWWDE